MSSDSLIPYQAQDLARRDSDQVSALTRSSDFLPQVRIYGGESEIVKEGNFPIGHFGLYFSAEKVIDLGEQFDVLVVEWRPRASIVSGDAPISFFGKFDMSLPEGERWVFSNEFRYVETKAMSKEKGYLAGLEYLFWIPVVTQWGLFFMGNPTLRRESANVLAFTGKAMSLKTKLIKTTQYTWHGCSAFACVSEFQIPEKDDVLNQLEKFRNPQDSDVEFEDTSKDSGRAR